MSEYIDKYIEEIGNHKRVTEKVLEGVYDFFPLSRCNDGFAIENALLKLGKLEDLEDELGIDLLAIVKALKDGIYIDHYHNGELYHMRMPLLQSDYDSSRKGSPIRIWLTYKKDGMWYDIDFKDYGRKWALTEEELRK